MITAITCLTPPVPDPGFRPGGFVVPVQLQGCHLAPQGAVAGCQLLPSGNTKKYTGQYRELEEKLPKFFFSPLYLEQKMLIISK